MAMAMSLHVSAWEFCLGGFAIANQILQVTDQVKSVKETRLRAKNFRQAARDSYLMHMCLGIFSWARIVHSSSVEKKLPREH
jgi:hypothetical protein